MAAQVHVTPDGAWWKVDAAVSADDTMRAFQLVFWRLPRSYSDKNSAVEHARSVARSLTAELVIHNRDGKISEKDSYGNDPFPPAG